MALLERAVQPLAKVTPGAYDWTLNNGDTVSLEIGNFAAVPEPGTLTLVGLGAAGLIAGGLRRRWRKVVA